MKFLRALVFAALVSTGLAAQAQAATYTENFEAVPFGQWKSGWFGTQSNAVNGYVAVGEDENYRGNNPDGLYLTDGIPTDR